MNVSASSAFHVVYRNRSYWLPFLISPSFLLSTIRLYYNWWLLAELLGHLCTALAGILFFVVCWKVKVMHFNMNILHTYTVMLVQINALTRLSLITVELTGTIDSITESHILICLLKTFVWVGIYNYVTFITFERYAALIFSSDYETNRRVWVSLLLILVNSLFSGMVSFLLVFELVDGVIYVLFVFCGTNLSCAAFMLIKAEYTKADSLLYTLSIRVSGYTVSQRWQVKDNVKQAKEIRFLIIGSTCQISFYLPFFFVPPLFLGDNPEWRAALEMSKAVFQMLSAYGFAIGALFALFAFSRHRDYVKSELGLRSTISPASMTFVQSISQTLEDHFASLRQQWN